MDKAKAVLVLRLEKQGVRPKQARELVQQYAKGKNVTVRTAARMDLSDLGDIDALVASSGRKARGSARKSAPGSTAKSSPQAKQASPAKSSARKSVGGAPSSVVVQDAVPVPKNLFPSPLRVSRKKDDMWAKMSKKEAELYQLELQRKAAAKRAGIVHHREELDRQSREARERSNVEQKEMDDFKASINGAAADYAAEQAALAAKKREKFLEAQREMQATFEAIDRRRKQESNARRAEAATMSAKAIKAAQTEKERQAAKKKHQRNMMMSTKRDNDKALAARRAAEAKMREEDKLRNEEAARAAAEKDDLRKAAHKARLEAIEAKLSAMNGTFLAAADLDREAALKAEREAEMRWKKEEEVAAALAAKKAEDTEEMKRVLATQVYARQRAKEREVEEARAMFAEALVADAAVAREKVTLKNTRRQRAMEYRAAQEDQIRASIEEKRAADESELELRMNGKMVSALDDRLDKERRAIALLEKADSVADEFRASAQREKAKWQAKGRPEVQLSPSGKAVLKRLDAATKRFAAK